MSDTPKEILAAGCRILDPLLHRYGFSYVEGPTGLGSGGHFASGTYVNGDRKLELHYRYSLGLVTYHFGTVSVRHESYMRAALGVNGGNKYPGFSDDPLDGFRCLAHDLENFAGAFLEGNEKKFDQLAKAAQEWERTLGFARIP